jgi:hypothetical protein
VYWNRPSERFSESGIGGVDVVAAEHADNWLACLIDRSCDELRPPAWFADDVEDSAGVSIGRFDRPSIEPIRDGENLIESSRDSDVGEVATQAQDPDSVAGRTFKVDGN